MGVHVTIEATFPTKDLAAHFAFVRFFTSVNTRVNYEMTLRSQRLLANVALKLPLTRMYAQMTPITVTIFNASDI